MLRVGKIVATHGLQGAVIIKHVIEQPGWLKKGDVLFVEMQKGSYIPHFVEEARAANEKEYIVTLDELTDPAAAKKLIGRQVYVKEVVLSQAKVDSPLLYIGFNLVDKERGTLGIIDDVMQAGQQWIAKVMVEGKEVLVPLVQEMILDINIKNKFIRMDLPAGLVEMYLDI